MRDVTDLKRGIESLRETARDLRHAEEIGHLGHWSVDLRTNRVSCSEKVFRILGVPADVDLAPERMAELVRPEDRDRSGQVAGETEYRIVRPGGSPSGACASGVQTHPRRHPRTPRAPPPAPPVDATRREPYVRRAAKEIPTIMWLNRAVAGCLAVTFLLSACLSGWRRIPVEDSLVLPRHQMAQVWRAGHVSRMYGLVVLADSLRGIPFPRPLSCDSCRVAIPRAEVDSIRVGNSDAPLVRGVLIAGFLAVMAYHVLLWRYGNWG